MVAEDGRAIVVLPARAPLVEAERMVGRHARWLERQRSRLAAERSVLAARPALGEGRRLLVAGETFRVAAVDGPSGRPARGRVEASPGLLVVRHGRDGRGTADLLEAWLRERARQVITARVTARAPELGVRPGRLSIRDPSTRWGSASASGSLSLSWRLVLMPSWVLDAVVVHELAHLRIQGHSTRFWSLVERHAPRTAEARRWLRENARLVRAALD
jgi:hypothetical protein